MWDLMKQWTYDGFKKWLVKVMQECEWLLLAEALCQLMTITTCILMFCENLNWHSKYCFMFLHIRLTIHKNPLESFQLNQTQSSCLAKVYMVCMHIVLSSCGTVHNPVIAVARFTTTISIQLSHGKNYMYIHIVLCGSAEIKFTKQYRDALITPVCQCLCLHVQD